MPRDAIPTVVNSVFGQMRGLDCDRGSRTMTGGETKAFVSRVYYCGNTMSTLNVKVPDEMENDIQDFLEGHPHYLNKSELVRDAIRHLIGSQGLSDRAREDIRVSREQIEAGETVGLEDLE